MYEELVKRFMQKVTKYSQEDHDKIEKAAYYANLKHENQKRKSGEPYIIHPLAVAETLIQMNMDADTVCAGLLHDVIEDTDTSEENITELFGKNVCELVQGVALRYGVAYHPHAKDVEDLVYLLAALLHLHVDGVGVLGA